LPLARPAPAAPFPNIDWRAALRRGIVKLLLFKLAALAALWALFFSPAHRLNPEPDQVGQQLSLRSATGAPPPASQEHSDD
jgi:hypothetical protein